MTSQICSYEGCYNQRFPFGSLTFFQLPNDEPRRAKWILNSGNKQLQHLQAHQKRYFCEYHFNEKDINPRLYRKLLFKNAVPVPYINGNAPTTTIRTADDKTIIYLDEVEKENETGGTYFTERNQVNGISDVECMDDGVERLDMSSSDVILLDDETDEHHLLESIVEEGTLTLQENCSDSTTTANSEAKDENVVIDQIPTISIDVDYLDTSPTTTSSAIITSTTSSTTTDNINAATSEKQSDAAATTSIVIINDNEVNIEPDASEDSYESDKHFALSLVYYFQRLNANKKAQAKIDILTYLVGLEQDNDA